MPPVSEPRPATPEAPDTATRILDAAEALFLEHGFSATSVRAIAREAGVNLGATHYHFGSKEGLLAAVVHRRFGPIHEARTRAVDALLARQPKPGVREIVDAFFAPLATVAVDTTPRLVARLLSEPPTISRPLMEREFGATFDRFAGLLGRALPGVDATEVRWRLHFAIGSMVHTLATESPIGTPADPDFVPRLAAFAAAGIEGGPPTLALAPAPTKGSS